MTPEEHDRLTFLIRYFDQVLGSLSYSNMLIDISNEVRDSGANNGRLASYAFAWGKAPVVPTRAQPKMLDCSKIMIHPLISKRRERLLEAYSEQETKDYQGVFSHLLGRTLNIKGESTPLKELGDLCLSLGLRKPEAMDRAFLARLMNYFIWLGALDPGKTNTYEVFLSSPRRPLDRWREADASALDKSLVGLAVASTGALADSTRFYIRILLDTLLRPLEDALESQVRTDLINRRVEEEKRIAVGEERSRCVGLMDRASEELGQARQEMDRVREEMGSGVLPLSLEYSRYLDGGYVKFATHGHRPFAIYNNGWKPWSTQADLGAAIDSQVRRLIVRLQRRASLSSSLESFVRDEIKRLQALADVLRGAVQHTPVDGDSIFKAHRWDGSGTHSEWFNELRKSLSCGSGSREDELPKLLFPADALLTEEAKHVRDAFGSGGATQLIARRYDLPASSGSLYSEHLGLFAYCQAHRVTEDQVRRTATSLVALLSQATDFKLKFFGELYFALWERDTIEWRFLNAARESNPKEDVATSWGEEVAANVCLSLSGVEVADAKPKFKAAFVWAFKTEEANVSNGPREQKTS